MKIVNDGGVPTLEITEVRDSLSDEDAATVRIGLLGFGQVAISSTDSGGATRSLFLLPVGEKNDAYRRFQNSLAELVKTTIWHSVHAGLVWIARDSHGCPVSFADPLDDNLVTEMLQDPDLVGLSWQLDDESIKVGVCVRGNQSDLIVVGKPSKWFCERCEQRGSVGAGQETVYDIVQAVRKQHATGDRCKDHSRVLVFQQEEGSTDGER